jgi:hypothetical protein
MKLFEVHDKWIDCEEFHTYQEDSNWLSMIHKEMAL